MAKQSINILGTKYTIHKETENENPKMEGNSGLCECYSKRILIDNTDEAVNPATVERYDLYCHRILRHEAFHALFHEAGMLSYSDDEILVDALATLYPKIREIMDKLDNMDIDTIQ